MCGGPVLKHKDAALFISFKDIQETQDRVTAWRAKHTEPILSAGDIMTFPDRLPWKWAHYGCDDSTGVYQIEGDRFNSLQKAIAWTLHLMTKNWFEFTDWASTVRRFFPECDRAT